MTRSRRGKAARAEPALIDFTHSSDKALSGGDQIAFYKQSWACVF